MAVTVVVPFTPGDPDRDAAWEWVRTKYESTHPDWEVVVGEGDPDRWVKADAVMPAIEDAQGIVLVADADVWCDPVLAVAKVEQGYAWAAPHGMVARLTKKATAEVLAGSEPGFEHTLAEARYVGALGGGIVVAPRETFLNIPLDRRFVGWGDEDRSWGAALTCLLGGPWRGRELLWHLWHEPQARERRNRGNPQSRALRDRYEAAEGHPDAMRALLEEARCQPTSPSSTT